MLKGGGVVREEMVYQKTADQWVRPWVEPVMFPAVLADLEGDQAVGAWRTAFSTTGALSLKIFIEAMFYDIWACLWHNEALNV